jgi:DNA repair exonuclease SbcCD ATPase subunit
MAIKLTRTELKSRDELVAKLHEASTNLAAGIETYNNTAHTLREALEDAISTYNTDLQTARDTLAPEIEAYNEVLAEIKEFAKEIKGRCQGEWDEKTERWQEGVKGTAAQQFIDAWDALGNELDDVVLDEIEELDAPGVEETETPEDVSEKILELPEAPEAPEN